MSPLHYVYFSPRLATEVVTLSIDMSTITSAPTSPTVVSDVYSGTADPSPAAILVGAPAVSGTMVSQQTYGGTPGTTYRLAFSVSLPGGDTRTVYGVLPVI